MKVVMFLLSAFSFFACNKNMVHADKDTYIPCASKTSLTGKWKATERYVSIGGPGNWNDLPTSERFYIEFKGDSTFSYSANFPKADSMFSRYSLSGTMIKVSSDVNAKKDTWIYGIDDQCKLSLSIYLCIEGCAYGLRRIE